MRVTASVQARLGSTRLPGKVLMHIGNQRILKMVYDQVEATDVVDESIIAIGDNSENDAIIEYCEREGARYVVGPEDNLLARHLAVVNETGCDVFVRITGDCPFVPSEEIERVVEEHLTNEARYTTNVTDAMPIGTAVDVIEPSLLKEFESLGETHPVKKARSNPDDWETIWTENPAWRKFSNVHMAVDTPDDYWSLIDAVQAVGKDPQAVAEWLD